jgi:hypothetical protein
MPPNKKVFRVVENHDARAEYSAYRCVLCRTWLSFFFLNANSCGRSRIGNEAFRYHGTKRECNIGDDGQPNLCFSVSCPACSILRTSFKVSVARDSGA